jgi:anti-sigma regulatory factor (Ser/Thr protein kinase)
MGESGSDLLALELRCNVAAPRRVRRALCKLEGLGWRLGDAMLIATELVTNALRHSACRENESIEVRVNQTEERLLISVQDPGKSGKEAKVQAPTDLGEGGVGLWVVEQLSRRWGDERDGGYRVWAELPLTG